MTLPLLTRLASPITSRWALLAQTIEDDFNLVGDPVRRDEALESWRSRITTRQARPIRRVRSRLIKRLRMRYQGALVARAAAAH